MNASVLKNCSLLLLTLFVLQSCEQKGVSTQSKPNDWEQRQIELQPSDSLIQGSTFLSIYSQIYIRREQEQTDLTATVSLHNPNSSDTLFIDKTVYYNTNGKPIRTYFDRTIFIRPMETVQIVIDDLDNEGGTGANFLFDWQMRPGTTEPLFEAVMISTYGQQGISFVTQGKRIK
ncbi:MAG: DUF3124 domain-containing protein [Marinirhabdus sp.]|nr:DUF3124 domain-containing protein [Marinirhabdus sp.]